MWAQEFDKNTLHWKRAKDPGALGAKAQRRFSFWGPNSFEFPLWPNIRDFVVQLMGKVPKKGDYREVPTLIQWYPHDSNQILSKPHTAQSPETFPISSVQNRQKQFFKLNNSRIYISWKKTCVRIERGRLHFVSSPPESWICVWHTCVDFTARNFLGLIKNNQGVSFIQMARWWDTWILETATRARNGRLKTIQPGFPFNTRNRTVL